MDFLLAQTPQAVPLEEAAQRQPVHLHAQLLLDERQQLRHRALLVRRQEFRHRPHLLPAQLGRRMPPPLYP